MGTLELGGKSPVYVDRSVSLDVVIPRLLSGKTLNSGQTCIAPDYILVHEEVQKQFLDALLSKVRAFFGSEKDAINSTSYGRIVNHRHYDRIMSLLNCDHGGKVLCGGADYANRDAKFIPVTIILNPDPNSPLMQEEIFGPLLPVLTVKDHRDAVRFINRREHPLALYVLSDDQAVYDEVVQETQSGGVCINDTLMQIGNPNMHFGGVGDSGLGAYHGKKGFEEFSHMKPVMFRSTWLKDASARFPPYDDSKIPVLKRFVIGPVFDEDTKKKIMAAGVAVATGLALLKSKL